MNETGIRSILIETFCHATESLEKVKLAILNLCGISNEELPEDWILEESRVYGGYGNDIVILKLITTAGTLSDLIFNNLIEKITRQDKVAIHRNFENQTDGKRNLFIRFNKQAAYLGSLSLTNEDPVKVQITFELGFTRKKDLPEKLKEYCLSTHIIEEGD
jgi:RNA binding exosome subunit